MEGQSSFNRRKFLGAAASLALTGPEAWAQTPEPENQELSDQEKANAFAEKYNQEMLQNDLSQMSEGEKLSLLNSKVIAIAQEVGLEYRRADSVSYFLFRNGYYISPLYISGETEPIIPITELTRFDLSNFDGLTRINGAKINGSLMVGTVADGLPSIAWTDALNQIVINQKLFETFGAAANANLPPEWEIRFTDESLMHFTVENEAAHFLFNNYFKKTRRQSSRVLEERQLAIGEFRPSIEQLKEFFSDAANVAANPINICVVVLNNMISAMRLVDLNTLHLDSGADFPPYRYSAHVLREGLDRVYGERGESLASIVVAAARRLNQANPDSSPAYADVLAQTIVRELGAEGLVDLQRHFMERFNTCIQILVEEERRLQSTPL